MNRNRYVLGSYVFDCHQSSRWHVLASIVNAVYNRNSMKGTQNRPVLWVLLDDSLGMAIGNEYSGSFPSYGAYMEYGGLFLVTP